MCPHIHDLTEPCKRSISSRGLKGEIFLFVDLNAGQDCQFDCTSLGLGRAVSHKKE